MTPAKATLMFGGIEKAKEGRTKPAWGGRSARL